VQVEAFLFTRSQRRDFTAFIRPAGMTNRDVSAIASALSNVNDVDRLTRAFPALYCFPLGDYVYLLRHYDSGRRHAGRAISVVEGIAARATWTRHFALAIPYLIAHQAEALNIAGGVGDIEAFAPVISASYELPEHSAEIVVPDPAYLDEFVARRAEDRLIVPFNAGGLILMTGALAERRFLSPLHFAFGTNRDVIAAFADAGISFDIVGLFNADGAGFRSRETGEKTGEVAVPAVESEPESEPQPAADMMTIRPRAVPTPTSIHVRDLPPVGGAAEVPEAERLLTMREARRQMRALQPVEPEPTRSAFDPFAALRRLLRLITGRRE
jgi:hypothetical protein